MPPKANKPAAPKKPTKPSAKSKTGNTACSQAASNWQLAIRGKEPLDPQTYATLAKCRAMTRTAKQADDRARMGYNLNEQGAAALKGRLQKRFDQGLITQKSRDERLKMLLQQRKVAKETGVNSILSDESISQIRKTGMTPADDKFPTMFKDKDGRMNVVRQAFPAAVIDRRNILERSIESRIEARKTYKDLQNKDEVIKDQKFKEFIDRVVTEMPSDNLRERASISVLNAINKNYMQIRADKGKLSKTEQSQVFDKAVEKTKVEYGLQQRKEKQANKTRNQVNSGKNSDLTHEKGVRAAADLAGVSIVGAKNLKKADKALQEASVLPLHRKVGRLNTSDLRNEFNAKRSPVIGDSWALSDGTRVEVIKINPRTIIGQDGKKKYTRGSVVDLSIISKTKGRTISVYTDKNVDFRGNTLSVGRNTQERSARALQLLNERKAKQAAVAAKPTDKAAALVSSVRQKPGYGVARASAAGNRELVGLKMRDKGTVTTQPAFTLKQSSSQGGTGAGRSMGVLFQTEGTALDKAAQAGQKAPLPGQAGLFEKKPAFSRQGQPAPGRGTEERKNLAQAKAEARKLINDTTVKVSSNSFYYNSHDPEKRAKTYSAGYTKDIQSNMRGQVKRAKTANDAKVILDVLKQHVTGMKTRIAAWANAESRTASWAVTGRGNFNSSRNLKRMDSAMNKSQEISDYSKGLENAVSRALLKKSDTGTAITRLAKIRTRLERRKSKLNSDKQIQTRTAVYSARGLDEFANATKEDRSQALKNSMGQLKQIDKDRKTILGRLKKITAAESNLKMQTRISRAL